MTIATPPPISTVPPARSFKGGQLRRSVQIGVHGAAVAAGGIAWALNGSILGAVVIAALFSIVGITATSWRVEGQRRAKDRLFTMLVYLAFVVALFPLISVLTLIVTKGAARFDGDFFSGDMRGVLGDGGGAFHAIIGTILITSAATLISVPIGVMSAVYLVEYGGRRPLARAVTFLVDVMTGIPSIVAGLFAFAFFSIFLGPSVRFGIGGAVALSVLMIPVVVRSVEEMLKLVPNELREASFALGVPRWRTILKVVLPTAAAGIAAGITLAIARVIGETAPLLIIAGATTSVNWDLFSGRMMSLPVFTYNSYIIPGARPEPSVDRAWAAALTLMLIVMVLNLAARLLARILGTKQSR